MTPELTPAETAWLTEGFAPCPMSGRFVPALMPVLCRREADRLTFRVEVRPAHCNGYKTAHGGFIATLADIWLAYNVFHRLPEGCSIVTSNLGVDYLSPVWAGDLLESQIDRLKIGGRLCHASGAILRHGQAVAAMRASFVVLESKQDAAGPKA